MLARLPKGEANDADLAKMAGGDATWNQLAQYLARSRRAKRSSRSIARLTRRVTVFPSFRFFVSFVACNTF
jgi:hypothetical protein